MDQVRVFQALKYESCPVSVPGKSLQRSRERLKTGSGDSRQKGRFLSDHHDTMMIIDDLSRVPRSGSTNKAFAPLKTGAAIRVDRAASQLLTQRLSRTSASWSSWALSSTIVYGVVYPGPVFRRDSEAKKQRVI